jgi:hypothetical protein
MFACSCPFFSRCQSVQWMCVAPSKGLTPEANLFRKVFDTPIGFSMRAALPKMQKKRVPSGCNIVMWGEVFTWG